MLTTNCTFLYITSIITKALLQFVAVIISFQFFPDIVHILHFNPNEYLNYESYIPYHFEVDIKYFRYLKICFLFPQSNFVHILNQLA